MMNAFEKFDACKFNDGFWCYKDRQKFRGWLFRLKHAVGVNGYSIKCHCENCESYSKRGVKDGQFA